MSIEFCSLKKSWIMKILTFDILIFRGQWELWISFLWDLPLMRENHTFERIRFWRFRFQTIAFSKAFYFKLSGEIFLSNFWFPIDYSNIFNNFWVLIESYYFISIGKNFSSKQLRILSFKYPLDHTLLNIKWEPLTIWSFYWDSPISNWLWEKNITVIFNAEMLLLKMAFWFGAVVEK